MSKLKLVIENDYNFDVIGIVSHEKSTKMCWLINNQLGFDLRREEPNIQITARNSEEKVAFDQFLFLDKENETDIRLLKNKILKFYWYKELKQYDYVLIIKPALYDQKFNEIMEELRMIDGVLTCSAIDVDSLKEKDKMLLD